MSAVRTFFVLLGLVALAVHGAPVAATPDAERSATGIFSGTVTAAGGSGLAGVGVEIFDASGGWVAAVATDDGGAYSSPSLAIGSYRARTTELTLGYVNELYDDIPCGFVCDIAAGAPIAVIDGEITEHIDFELALGGRIGGTVTDVDGGAALPGIIVDLFDQSGVWVSNPATDGAGIYLSPGLPPGSYFAITYNDSHYVDELYDGVPCLGCATTLGEGIALVAGATVDGVDFTLGRGGSISGNVTDQATDSALADVHVEVWSRSGQLLAWSATDVQGDYTVAALPGGYFFVKTWNDIGYINEVFRDRACAFCDPTAGEPIAVVPSATTPVDFALARGGSISGEVTVADPDSVELIAVHIHDQDGNWVDVARPEASGTYLTPVGLPTGTYYARTGNGRGYLNQVWDGVPCIGACVPTDGTAIPVKIGVTASGVDFELAEGGRVAGTVTEAGSGLPIDDSEVGIFDSSGQLLMSARVGPTGEFRTWGALPPGEYYAATRNFAGFHDELYSEAACPGGGEFCSMISGTTISLKAGQTTEGIHFTLVAGGWFEGKVFDEAWARGLSGIDIPIFDDTGQLLTRVAWHRPLRADGRYKTCALPAGNYYARTDSTLLQQDYAEELFDDVFCPAGCDPKLGTRIPVVSGNATTGVDFGLRALVFEDGFESGTLAAWSRLYP